MENLIGKKMKTYCHGIVTIIDLDEEGAFVRLESGICVTIDPSLLEEIE